MSQSFDINVLREEARSRWLKPSEVYYILQNHERFLITREAPNKPPSGSLFLYNRRVLRYFRRDGHTWRRKKDGRTVGEAHERLKVGDVDSLSCYYAHGEQNIFFQRRCFWMLEPAHEHIVLVHYREVAEGRPLLSIGGNQFHSSTSELNVVLKNTAEQLSLGEEDDDDDYMTAEQLSLGEDDDDDYIYSNQAHSVGGDNQVKQIQQEGTQKGLNRNIAPSWEDVHSSSGLPTSSIYQVAQTSQGLYTETVRENSRYMELNILERIVHENEEPSPLDFALLHSITEKFSEKKKIGSGGCGTIYKGILRNGVVAVKRLHNSRTIKDKLFHREVLSLISVKHPNIVRFLGYCSFTEEHAISIGGTIIMADIRERLLCFEYIRNGSLDQHLSDELRGLEWQTRYQIIIGICKGLHYLHKDKEIIHMDLKPGNILLDDLMVPKITDFGLSRPESDSHATTTRFISCGYTAPEYSSGGKATSKSDIYSLGVIIIELVTGSRMKPNITKVIRRWNHRWIKSMKQSSLAYHQQVDKCLQLALRCIQDVPTGRPDISDIIHELEEIDTTDIRTQIQISPCCLEDILGIEPLEIRVPFEHFKISHLIELTNDTDDYIAFDTNAKLERFCTEPNRGIVPPRSKLSVTVAMQARFNVQPNVHYTEVITVLSTRVDGAPSVDAMDVTSGEIFIDKEGKVVDEVNVMVIFGMPQL